MAICLTIDIPKTWLPPSSFYGGAKELTLAPSRGWDKIWLESFWKSLKSVLGCFVSENTRRILLEHLRGDLTPKGYMYI